VLVENRSSQYTHQAGSGKLATVYVYVYLNILHGVPWQGKSERAGKIPLARSRWMLVKSKRRNPHTFHPQGNPMNKRKIVVIGSSNVDLVMKMERLPKRGETVTNTEFMQTFGGKGANQAMAAAKAGGEVYFVNCVGDDRFGDLVIENLRNGGVNTDFVFQESGVASGTALIMVDGAGENYISVAPGANYRLKRSHIDRVSKLIAEAGMVVMQYEILEDTIGIVVEKAAALGRRIMFNLAPAAPIAEEILARLDIFIVNEVEAEYVCGYPLEGIEKVRRAAAELHRRGPKLVNITLGARGCYLFGEHGELEVPAFKVNAVDSTAAGDVYCGALAVALVEDRPLAEAVRFASAASAISVTRMGAQPSIPTHVEIENFLSAN
jgi:ribokinase